jgi:hemoglobin-like flavoprotein
MSSALMIYSESLKRCLAHPEFVKRFYDRFIPTSPEISARFKDTNHQKQEQMIRTALQAVPYFDSDASNAAELRRLAIRHKEMAILPKMYDAWLACLLATVKEVDSKYDQKVEDAWKEVVSKAVRFFRSLAR